jgi:hypothetical protein
MHSDERRAADRAEAAAWRDMYAAAPPELDVRAEVAGGATILTAPRLPLGLFNRVIGADWASGADVTDAYTALFGARGVRKYFVHVWEDEHPAEPESRDLVHALPPYWAKLVWRGPDEPLTSALSVRVVAPDDAAAVARIVCAANEMPSFLIPWVASVAARANWRIYGAYDGADLVAGALMWTGREGAWLGLAGTAVSARRRGAQRALLRARVEDARAADAAVITTETWAPTAGAHNSSLANMLRAGFVEIGRRANYTRAIA